MKHCDVAVIGAGPYGLSATAHLRAHGLETITFGEPMSFWSTQMPEGMLLRSPCEASDLSEPNEGLTLRAYREALGTASSSFVSRDQFVEYGRWFQKQQVPCVDSRHVSHVEKAGDFRITLEDGEEVHAARVVVAAGIGSFPNRPSKFAGFPSDQVSHSSEHENFCRFSGKAVVVIGGGQSALEYAALLHEAGAKAEVLVRAPHVKWLRPKATSATHAALERLLWGPAGIGAAGISRLVERPDYYRHLPELLRVRFGRLRPAGAAWLPSRLKDVPIHTGVEVALAVKQGDKVRLTLEDGTQHLADHVLLATGYTVDISRYAFLAPELLRTIDTVNGFPRLHPGFESSVKGLHFIGAPAAWSFGPLMRFVAGARFAARELARRMPLSAVRAASTEPAPTRIAA